MISALVLKDVKLFFRNPLFVMLTALSVISFLVVYFALPSSTDDSFAIALSAPTAYQNVLKDTLGSAIKADVLGSSDAVVEAVKNSTDQAGLVITDEQVKAIQHGDPVSLPLYFAPGTTADLSKALTDSLGVGLNAINFSTTTNSAATIRFHVNEQLVVLGTDVLGIGKPIALRDRMIPILLLLILTVEAMGLANLITEEVEFRTVRALMVTPLRPAQFFASKAIMGVGLAFVEVLLVALITGKLATSPLIVIATLLIGSLLITGVAFLVASVAKDLMSVIAWTVLVLIILGIPGISIMFPTLSSDWIKAIPSYYLVDSLHRTMNLGAGWTDVAPDLVLLFVSGVIVLGLGSLALRRRLI